MRYKAYEDVQEGQAVIVLADRKQDSIAIFVPSIGFNLIRCRLGGHETIEGPPDLPTLGARSSEFGVPLLWPPGRIADGAFSFRGKSYVYPVHDGVNHLHGEIRMRHWQIVSLEADDKNGASVTAEYRFEAIEDHGVYYPHAVLLRMRWKLTGNRISGELEAFNSGNEDAPFGFGLHPYFKFRGKPEEIEITAPTRLQYTADDDGLNRQIPVPTELCGQLGDGMTLDLLPSDVDHFVFRMAEGSASAQISMMDGDVRIGFECDSGFPYLVVFKPKWADALSLEPWSCISDAYNSPLSPEWTGAAGLRAGERRKLEWAWQADKA